MSIAARIAQRIKYLPRGTPFSIERFTHEGSRAAVDKALSRLTSAGQLERVARGVYMRPKISRYAGHVQPSASAVIGVIAGHHRETIQVHGAEALRAFSLSTQMQVQPIFYTSGTSRQVKIGQMVVCLRHVSPEKLQHAGTRVGLALSALFYLGRKGVDGTVVASLKAKLTEAEFKQLAACRMPAWMQTAIRQAGAGESDD